MGANTGVSVAASKPKVGGGLYQAPLGTPLPTTETTTLNAAFKALGPISQEGIKPSRDTSVEKIKEWDGSTLASLLTDESRAFEVVLYGYFDVEVQQWIYGVSNVTVTAATAAAGTKMAIVDKGGKPDNCVVVIDMRHDKKVHRVVIPNADCVVTDEGQWAGSNLKSYTVTIEAIKDASGNRVYEYLDDGMKTA